MVIITYNVWNKTPESIFRLHEASEVLNKYVMGVWQVRNHRAKPPLSQFFAPSGKMWWT